MKKHTNDAESRVISSHLPSLSWRFDGGDPRGDGDRSEEKFISRISRKLKSKKSSLVILGNNPEHPVCLISAVGILEFCPSNFDGDS